MHPKKIVISGIFAALLLVLFFSFRTSPPRVLEKTLKTSGLVEEIFETQTNPIVFKLYNDDRIFYIRDDLQNGMTVEQLRSELKGKPVEIHYVTKIAPLAFLTKRLHVSRVEVDKTILYSVPVNN